MGEDNQQRMQDCLIRATRCEERAGSAKDPQVRETFAEAARCWRDMAVCWDELRNRRS